MKRSQYTETQIVGILKSVEQGAKVTVICREHGISSVSRIIIGNKHGCLEASDLKR